MMFAWNLSSQPFLPMDAPRRVERVLVAYEGPIWTVLSDGAQKFIAYAADHDEAEGIVRWIEAPVSGVELRALCHGKMPLRDAILKASARVVDYSVDHRPLRHWDDVPCEDIPADCLPDEDALLPRFARDPVEAPADEGSRISIECDGPSVRQHAMSFAALGAVMVSIQRLWSSLAVAVDGLLDVDSEWGGATLAFAGARPGSFAIDVATNPQAFSKIAAKYKELVRTSYSSPSRLGAELELLDARVSLAYKDYVRTLELYGLDVFADWHEDGVFVGAECARRVSALVWARRGGRGKPKKVTVDAKGYFGGWMSEKKRFEFFNVVTGEQYIGTISKKLAGPWAEKPPSLGRAGKQYAVRVRMTVGEDDESQPTWHLLSVTESA